MKIYIDEAGRGPLAGPVYVGLVAICSQQKCIKRFGAGPSQYKTLRYTQSDSNPYRNELRDSKQLSAKNRNRLYEHITTDNKLVWSTGRKSGYYIHKHGIIKALREAICEGLWKMCSHVMLNDSEESYQHTRVLRSAQNDYSSQNNSLSIPQDKEEASLGGQGHSHTYSIKQLRKTLNHLKIELIIDGNHDFGLSKKLGIPIATVVKGDSIHKELSAASICAKVERDWYMIRQAKKFPLYGFDRHKGYGTAYHRAMIRKHGLCKLHRESWCG